MISTSFIKGIQDIMRQDTGVDGDAQRISQLAWMIFLKIIDDSEREQQALNSSYIAAVPTHLQWRAWAADSEGITGETLLNFINNTLFPELRVLEETSNARTLVVRGVFQDSFNYMKSGTLIRQVLNKIDTIDFTMSTDRHNFNDLYETLLQSLQSAGDAAEYYTPRAVTQFIVAMVDPKVGESVLDPACGTGGFLSNTIEYVRKQIKTPEEEALFSQTIRGVEKKPLPHLLCTTNMILHGIEVPTHVVRDNTLTRPLRDYGPADKVDVVVMNPPFGGTEEPGVEMNFPADFRSRETADLFLVLISHLLKSGGRAGIVLPDGFLFGEGVKTRIKKHLLETCNLHTIVRLPNNVFAPYTGIRTNLLFFTKGEPTKEIWYYEHPYPTGQKSYNKTNPIRFEEFLPEMSWWNNRAESEQSWKVTLDEIERRNFNLDIKNPNTISVEDASPSELLEAYRAQQAKVQGIVSQLQIQLKEVLQHHDN